MTDEEHVYVPPESLGEILFGDRIQPSTYNLKFLENQTCVKVCDTKKYKPQQVQKDALNLKFIANAIRKNYQHHWIVDNMPVTWCFMADKQYCNRGFPLGCYVSSANTNTDSCTFGQNFEIDQSVYINNHVDLIVTYHSGENEKWGSNEKRSDSNTVGRVVSVKVNPRSIKNKSVTFLIFNFS